MQQLGQYLTEVQTIGFRAGSAFTALEFWKTRQAIYPKPAPVAPDILAAPASQTYVDRLFSVCGLLCSERRNHMTRSLTVGVCLKMNMLPTIFPHDNQAYEETEPSVLYCNILRRS